ncbi:MAG TPA: hypothetical protein VGZ23_04750 [bacterium]|nr:hypothetical protein [bacterium]
MGVEEIQVMRARVARAERRLRIMSLGWLAAAVVAAVLWTGAPRAQSQTAVLSARRIAVVDQKGKDRISLALDSSNNPAIWLRDDAGKDRLFIGFGKLAARPLIELSDETGRVRVTMGLSPDRDTPQVVLLDENGRQRGFLGFSASGTATPEFDLADEHAMDRITFGWSPADKPVLMVRDPSGKTIWSAP